MKKFMTLAAFAAIAVGAQAATITWGLGADIYLTDTDYNNAKVAYESSLVPDSGSYLALVYVGQNATTFDIGNITDASVIATNPYALDTDGSTYADWDPYQTTTQVSASTYSDGASFAVVWFDGTAFDYVYSIDDGSALNSATTFADMTRGSDTIFPAETTNGFGGVLTVSVPEPGIACMALLGIGMMLKRRRA